MRVYKALTQQQKDRKKELHRIWCAANREKRRDSARRFRINHSESWKERSKAWWMANKDRKKEYSKKYRERHSEFVKTQSKLYHSQRYRNDSNYRNAIIDQSNEWRLNHPDKIREIYKKWRKNNLLYCSLKGAKRRALIKQGNVNERGLRDFIERIKTIGFSTCYYCGLKVPVGKLHIDHVNPICNGGEHSLSNICTSCPRCNFSKNRSTLATWPKTGQLFLNL